MKGPLSPREVDAVIDVARRAAALIRRVDRAGFRVSMKGRDDPVTDADREANTLICRRLARLFPRDAIVAEESAPPTRDAVAALVAERRVWFVDPLDGTREFVARTGEYAVMIGLAVEGRAAFGVLALPATGELFVGAPGAGGQRIAPDGRRSALAVSRVRDVRRARVLVSRTHRPRWVDALAREVGVREVRELGSVGVKVARIASGDAEVYVHGGGSGAKRWDSCAPEAVLLAAGGRLTDLAGQPIDYAASDLALRSGIIATNGRLHAATMRAVRERLGGVRA